MLKRLKDLREEQDLTQNDLAKILKIARSNISKYENGDLDPNIEILKKYADYFVCSVDYILGRTNNRIEVLVRPERGQSLIGKAKDANVSLDELEAYIEARKKTQNIKD